MDATASIFTRYKNDVLTVPKRAVRFDEKGKKYVTVLSKDQAEKRFIATGISDENYYEVASGLRQGDKVIIN